MLFVDFSSSPKKWAPEHNITNTDMGSEGLQAPQAFPALSSPQRISTSSQGSRKKVEYFKMFYYLFIYQPFTIIYSTTYISHLCKRK